MNERMRVRERERERERDGDKDKAQTTQQHPSCSSGVHKKIAPQRATVPHIIFATEYHLLRGRVTQVPPSSDTLTKGSPVISILS